MQCSAVDCHRFSARVLRPGAGCLGAADVRDAQGLAGLSHKQRVRAPAWRRSLNVCRVHGAGQATLRARGRLRLRVGQGQERVRGWRWFPRVHWPAGSTCCITRASCSRTLDPAMSDTSSVSRTNLGGGAASCRSCRGDGAPACIMGRPTASNGFLQRLPPHIPNASLLHRPADRASPGTTGSEDPAGSAAQRAAAGGWRARCRPWRLGCRRRRGAGRRARGCAHACTAAAACWGRRRRARPAGRVGRESEGAGAGRLAQHVRASCLQVLPLVTCGPLGPGAINVGNRQRAVRDVVRQRCAAAAGRRRRGRRRGRLAAARQRSERAGSRLPAGHGARRQLKDAACPLK